MQKTLDNNGETLIAGAAKEDITPLFPLRLCGFGDREGNFDKVLEPLYIRCVYLEQKGLKLVLISADILWWGSKLVERIQNEAFSRYSISPDMVLLSATHNHSGPPTDDHVLDRLESYSPEYADYLFEKAVHVIGLAIQNKQSAKLSRYSGNCNINVNRRLMVNGKIEMMPNYSAPRDTTLTVLRLENAKGDIIAHMHHYACHATVSAENNIQPEYPGIANRLLDDMFPGSTNVFWQGATADMRPNIVLGDQFLKLGYDESIAFAKLYVASIQKALESPSEQLNAELSFKTETALLPIKPIEPKEKLIELSKHNSIEGEWAKKVLNDNYPQFRPCNISLLYLADNCPLLFFNAELVQSYARFARELHPSCITIGYTNGMIGYICSEKEMEEGGYEPYDSHLWFALPGPYTKETQKILEGALSRLSLSTKSQ